MSKKILIAGAGGAPSEGVIYSLLLSPQAEEIIGMGSVPFDLAMSKAARKYLVPWSYEKNYHDALLKVLDREKSDLVHFQNDIEVYYASLMRDEILAAGAVLYMPEHEVIENCVNKWKSYQKFRMAGIPVPENMMIYCEDDLKRAFSRLGDDRGRIWLRAVSMGGGGKGSLPTNDYHMAKAWLDRHRGWGDFAAAEMLTENTVTWQSIWWEGELVVAQTRRRKGWVHGNRTVSGVTGVTKTGITCSDGKVDKTAQAAVFAVAGRPHGIFGVDMVYDENGVPNPTEINISRFFTTVRFFTEAGLNMPVIFKDLALYGKKPELERKINPLPDGLMWLRSMDTEPVMLTEKEIERRLVRL